MEKLKIKPLRRLVVCLFALVLLASCYNNKPKNKVTNHIIDTKETISDMELTPNVRDLVKEIEKLCGKPLQIEYKDFENKTHLGDSRITKDGVPVIGLNKSIKPTKTTIVHELCHLELRVKGYKTITFLVSAKHLNERNIKFLNLLQQQLRDPIEHTIFYPKIRAMGIDPAEDLKSFWVKHIHEKNGLNNGLDNNGHTLNYFTVLLEIDDKNMCSQIEQFYKNNHWNKSLDVANKLKEIVLRRNPKTSEEQVATTLECAKAFYPETASYELAEYKTLPRDLQEYLESIGKNSDNTVFIMVSPPK